MATASGDVESGVPLQAPPASRASGQQGIGVESGLRFNYNKCTVALGVVSLVLLITVIALAVSSSGRSPAVQGPACPDGWIGYQRKCHYFSGSEGNWTYSQSNCSALGASLAEINTLQELAFVARCKGRFDLWIGLRRDAGQAWKWANGTEFNNLFPIAGDGDCAYLNDNRFSSSRCTSERYWICSKPDVFTEAAVKGAEK
ncbi:C-type lectin domain family 2 member D-like [Pelodiscus sinensis]|uniref:C-type lectin domain family 2 member D-like n=1 Tax=Pelodiscus sinensis TaxID=13735 RepID=UPI003F6D2354